MAVLAPTGACWTSGNVITADPPLPLPKVIEYRERRMYARARKPFALDWSPVRFVCFLFYRFPRQQLLQFPFGDLL